MNVRFFGGTRAQYDSLVAPRNPMGLYFCADTRELFWGDKLLTDGTRIVTTEAALPNLAQAADGITYFVEETRNGYVVSPDRTKWVKVIQAPEGTGKGDVKAISFAGTVMEEVDGVFTIDRRCAREALGFKVPEGLEDEEIVIATEDFVKDEIAKIEIPGANLDNYATKQYVSDAIEAINPVVEEVKTKLEKEVLPKVEETILPTVQKVETEVIPTVQELAKKAATQKWVQEQGYLTAHQDLSEYAKKTDLDEFATTESVEALADTLDSTNSQLDRVTRATVSLQETVGTLKIPTKVSELDNDAGYLTEHQDLSEYVKKSEIPSVEGLASEEFVLKKIAEAELADQDVDLSAYYTKSETEAAIKSAVDAIDVPDVSNLATKEELEAVQNVAGSNSVKLMQLDSDLVDINNQLDNIQTTYATKDEVVAVEAKVDAIAIPEVPTKVSELENDVGYTKLLQITTFEDNYSGYPYTTITNETLLECFNSIVANEPILMQFEGDVVSFKKFNDSKIWLTVPAFAAGVGGADSDNNGTIDKRTVMVRVYNYYEYGCIDGIWKFIKSGGDRVDFDLPTKISELENDIGYITSEDIPETDLSNYYNKTETENLIAEAVKDIEHPTVDLEGYATEAWVNEQGFLKEHQDLSEYAKKSDIPEAELFVVDFNTPDFAAAIEAYNNGKLLLLVNAAPDANGYAVMNYVRADLITFTKFLTSRSEAYGSFNTYYLHSDNTWEISKEVKLNKVEANVADEPTAELTSLRVGKEVYKLPDLANYVTNEILEQNYITQEEIANTYVTENYIVNNYVTQEAAKNTYVTNEQVTEVVTNEVNTVVTEQIETKVETVIQEKVDTGEIKVNSISYGEF